ncbi:MAG: helix-turn-helix transcriptional regulator [Gammaproteobacteria bacterium]|nr:helix-turn-helix transcriptional regulator [Gammaproteobacteria bacterium]
MTPNESAGKNITQYRQENDLSLAHLAESSHLPVSRLCDIEHGVGTVTVQEFCRIARALECDPCDLLLSGLGMTRKY